MWGAGASRLPSGRGSVNARHERCGTSRDQCGSGAFGKVAASERRALDEGMVMAEFTEASRHAESFPEAIRMALAMLRETIGDVRRVARRNGK
jgi:hypothetical protein